MIEELYYWVSVYLHPAQNPLIQLFSPRFMLDTVSILPIHVAIVLFDHLSVFVVGVEFIQILYGDAHCSVRDHCCDGDRGCDDDYVG